MSETNNTEEQKISKISFSEYSTYLQCQHKWYLNYYLRLPGDFSDELIFGSALHNTIECILTKPLFKNLYKMDKSKTVKDLFKGFLVDELKKITDEPFLIRFHKQGLANIFLFQAEKLLIEWDFFNRFKDYEIADVEFHLDAMELYSNEKVRVNFKGFIDLVLKHKTDGTILIIDWKTSSAAWDIAKKLKDNTNFFAQLALYKYFYSKAKNIPLSQIETRFYNFPRNVPKEQSPFSGNLKETYILHFIEGFIETTKKIQEHKETLGTFDKVKFITKKNFCFRCKFNTEEFCNDIDEHQFVTIKTTS